MFGYRHATHRTIWRRIHRSPLFDIVQFILLVVLILWFFAHSTLQLGYNWQWYRVPRYLYRMEEGQLVAGELIEGLLFTLRISGISLVLAFALGLGTSLMRLSGPYTGRLLARGYLEVIRNTPLVVSMASESPARAVVTENKSSAVMVIGRYFFKRK